MPPRDARGVLDELDGLAVFELDGEPFPGPKERKFRNERKGARPPGELDEPEFTGGCVGLPLTARCLVGATKPRLGVHRELGSVL
jgi:hypothetical protein